MRFLLLLAAVCLCAVAQEPGAGKPTDHLIGTITAVDGSAHTVTIKDDKSGSEQTILLGGTKTLIKVPPGAKDLKSGVRITADDLAVGDRVDVRGSKPPGDPARIAARSVVLMSGRDLEAAHRQQAAAWQNATAGVVTAIDPAAQKITINARTPEGPKPLVLQVSNGTEFTRFSPDHPATPAASQIGQIQPGDQLRAIGEESADGATVEAQRVYSGAFRTINGTVMEIAGDGKELTLRDLASKKPVHVSLNENSSVQRIPPEMAAVLARRMNGAGAPGAGAPGAGAPRSGGAAQPAANPPSSTPPPGGAGFARGPRNGDISRLLERLPKINVSDLKPGDAVVVAGTPEDSAGAQQQLIATHIIAGVEPILQSAPARQGSQGLGGDWGLGEISVPQ